MGVFKLHTATSIAQPSLGVQHAVTPESQYQYGHTTPKTVTEVTKLA